MVAECDYIWYRTGGLGLIAWWVFPPVAVHHCKLFQSHAPRKRKWPCPFGEVCSEAFADHSRLLSCLGKLLAHIFWLNSHKEFISSLAPRTLGRAWLFLQSSLVPVKTNCPEMHLYDPQLIRLICIIFTSFLSSLYIFSDDMCLELRLLIPFFERDGKKNKGVCSLYSSGKALSWKWASCMACFIWDRSNVPQGNTGLN